MYSARELHIYSCRWVFAASIGVYDGNRTILCQLVLCSANVTYKLFNKSTMFMFSRSVCAYIWFVSCHMSSHVPRTYCLTCESILISNYIAIFYEVIVTIQTTSISIYIIIILSTQITVVKTYAVHVRRAVPRLAVPCRAVPHSI